MIKKLFGLLFLSSCAWAFNPIQYVQISTQTPAPSQQGGIGVSSITVTSATITNLSITGSLANVTIGTATVNGQLNAPFIHYRQPVLQYVSGSAVGMETGLDGTLGDGVIIFPDGTRYTESISTSTRLIATLSQNANWGNGTQQGGIRPGEALTNNSWYSFYAVKSTVTADTTNFVLVGSTIAPVQSSYTLLNTNFGANAWRYLGTVPYGDGASVPAAISSFTQAGNMIQFRNNCAGNAPLGASGLRYATSAAGQTLSWAYVQGQTVGTTVPPQLTFGYWLIRAGTTAASVFIKNQAATYFIGGSAAETSNGPTFTVWQPLTQGILMTTNTNNTEDITLDGYIDGVLGLGQPLL